MALTPVQIAAAAYIGGFNGDDVAAATQLALTVSGGNPGKTVNDHYGLWQIKKAAHPDLFKKYVWNNPADNARMANVLWQKRATLLHSSGQWSKKDWPVLGTPSHVMNKLVADTAWKDLKQQMEKGASPEKILGASRTDGSKTPEGGIGGTVTNTVVANVPPWDSLLKTVYNMGIQGSVLLGAAILVVLGVVILLRKPLEKAAKVVK